MRKTYSQPQYYHHVEHLKEQQGSKKTLWASLLITLFLRLLKWSAVSCRTHLRFVRLCTHVKRCSGARAVDDRDLFCSKSTYCPLYVRLLKTGNSGGPAQWSCPCRHRSRNLLRRYYAYSASTGCRRETDADHFSYRPRSQHHIDDYPRTFPERRRQYQCSECALALYRRPFKFCRRHSRSRGHLFHALGSDRPILSILISLIVFRGGYKIVKNAWDILMEKVPDELDTDEIIARMKEHPNVLDVHEFHLSAITTGHYNLSAHVVVDNRSDAENYRVINELAAMLKETYSLDRTTLQVEHLQANHLDDPYFEQIK